jgi:hypothetical protein
MATKKWFYKIEHIEVREPIDATALHDLSVKLDSLGAEGWEAISVVQSLTRVGNAFVIFKRERE